MLFGKNAQSLRELNKHIRERGSIEKFYMTIVKGELREKLHLQDFMVKDREKNLASIVSEKQAARMGARLSAWRPLLNQWSRAMATH